jgi:hypothetical protein
MALIRSLHPCRQSQLDQGQPTVCLNTATQTSRHSQGLIRLLPTLAPTKKETLPHRRTGLPLCSTVKRSVMWYLLNLPRRTGRHREPATDPRFCVARLGGLAAVTSWLLPASPRQHSGDQSVSLLVTSHRPIGGPCLQLFLGWRMGARLLAVPSFQQG